MKVPLRWLADYVSINLPIPELVERLTLAGLEVASAKMIGQPIPEGLRVNPDEVGPVWDRDKIFIGKLLRVEPHPNADRLKLPTVEYGGGEPKTMVTGAPNIAVGMAGQKVVLALSGSVLFDGHSQPKALKALKPAQIRGVPSDAMVCSEYELGISDEHEGVIILEDDAPVGKPLADYLGDCVLDIDITPNLARCLSMLGVAREVAALTGQRIRLPAGASDLTADPIEGQVAVRIEDPKLCGRYLAMLIKQVKIGPSPAWMQRRLQYAGIRPISNIVDITNYVMLEWGQPLHAFDYDLLKQRAGGAAPTIIVRPARAGETLTTLDGQKRELTPENLLIADTAGPIALAGVMGGKDTEVTATTTNILLESASFDLISVRRTMRHFHLPSEASVRFSKGIHPEVVKPAAERAAELMRQHAKGRVCKGMVDSYPAPRPEQIVALEIDEVRKLLGVPVPVKEIVHVLQSLEYEVQQAGPDMLRVKVPPHRTDVQAGSADLIEDIARIHGYDRLPAVLLADELPEQHTNRPLVLEEQARDILVNCGLQEVITYSLTMPEREKPLGLPEADYVRLLNPISPERSVLRRQLLPGVLEAAASNLKHFADVRLFEIGAVYLPQAGAKLPDEPRRVALVLSGRRATEYWGDGQTKAAPLDFFDLKGIVETMAGDLHLPQVSIRPTKDVPYLHPGQAAELVIGDRVAGVFGLFHPKVSAAYGLAGRDVLAAELDLGGLIAAVPDRYVYRSVARFPAALRDIAIIVEQATPAERVVAEIRAAGGDLLADVRLFDVYQGTSIPAGTKSLAYALSYQADDRTLTDKEVDKAHKKIEDRLKHVLKAQVRGKD